MYHEGGIHTLASVSTKAGGRASAELGLGDVIAFAYKDGLYGMTKVPGSVDNVKLMLSHSVFRSSTAEFELSPPPKNPDWRYIKSNDDVWAPMDSVKVARLRAHPTDEARVQSFIDEPRRVFLPEIEWPVIGNVELRLQSDSEVTFGRELSVYQLKGGSLMPVTQPFVPFGTYLVVTGTTLSENYKYKVRLEVCNIPEGRSQFDISVSMPSI